jgi:hypothetical protein
MKYTSDYLVLFQSCQVQPAPWLCRPTASPRLARGLRRQASLGPRAEGPVGLKAGGGLPGQSLQHNSLVCKSWGRV